MNSAKETDFPPPIIQVLRQQRLEVDGSKYYEDERKIRKRRSGTGVVLKNYSIALKQYSNFFLILI